MRMKEQLMPSVPSFTDGNINAESKGCIIPRVKISCCEGFRVVRFNCAVLGYSTLVVYDVINRLK